IPFVFDWFYVTKRVWRVLCCAVGSVWYCLLFFAALDLRTCVSLSRLGRMALRLRLLACLWGPYGQDWRHGVPGVVFELLLAQCERPPPRQAMAARRRAHSSSHGGVAAVGLAAVCSFICRREVQGRAALREAQRVGGRWWTRCGAQQRRAREDPAALSCARRRLARSFPLGCVFILLLLAS
ncbi:hypothetical protein TraAM80_06323, partial [Trypanosoma rangeli]